MSGRESSKVIDFCHTGFAVSDILPQTVCPFVSTRQPVGCECDHPDEVTCPGLHCSEVGPCGGGFVVFFRGLRGARAGQTKENARIARPPGGRHCRATLWQLPPVVAGSATLAGLAVLAKET